ncbi:MAG TPA: hypothetical protein VGR27_15280 [Longimicrobiaceae bacterium]|nr:hypothetical protein [Longimicrobiaceae bacterium]
MSMPRTPPPRAVLWVGALLALQGCYHYVPVQLDSVPTGAEVRGRLAPEGIASLEGLVSSNGRVVEGRLLERDERQVLLFIPAARAREGYQVETLRQAVAIPRSHIYEVELKQLDRTRTYGIAALAGVVVAAVVVRAISGGGESSGGTPGGGGGTEWRGVAPLGGVR